MKFISLDAVKEKLSVTYWSVPQRIVAGTLLVIAAVLVLHLFLGPLFYTNATGSAPRGVYVTAPDQHIGYGDYVIVRSPVAIPDIKLPEGLPLLKKAAGFPGDSYTVTENTLSAGGNIYPVYRKSYLPRLEPGRYTVPDGSILFLNDPVYSLDSRYIGPVRTSCIEKKVVLLINYDAVSRFLYLHLIPYIGGVSNDDV